MRKQNWIIGGSYAIAQDSYIVKERKFSKPDEENDNLVCVYSITEPGEVQICYKIDNVQQIIVDGVSMDPVKKYNFEVGKHTIEFVLIDKTLMNKTMFRNCSNLISVNIPSFVEVIEDDVFYRCSSLTSIKVSKNNPVYDSRNNCNAIIKTATNTLIVGTENTIILNSITSIGDTAFREKRLEAITIPDSVTSIGKNAFNKCESLKSIHLSKNLVSIDRSSFTGCDNITSITMNENDYFYAKNNVLVDKSTYSTLLIPNIEHIIIPERVKSIGPCSNRTILKTITLNEQLERIENNGFRNCTNLESIVIPNSVTYLGDYAFMNCVNLKTCILSNNIKEILDSTFNHCESLESITIPAFVTSIGSSVFSFCESLSEIICLGTEPIIFSSGIFNSLPSSGVLKIPAGSNTGLESQLPEGWTVEYI